MATTALVQRRTTLMTDPVFGRWDYPIVTAWGIGMILRHITKPLLHISSSVIVLSSLGVMLTGL